MGLEVDADGVACVVGNTPLGTTASQLVLVSHIGGVVVGWLVVGDKAVESSGCRRNNVIPFIIY